MNFSLRILYQSYIAFSHLVLCPEQSVLIHIPQFCVVPFMWRIRFLFHITHQIKIQFYYPVILCCSSLVSSIEEQ
jgi:hypothetical protein